MRFAPWLVLAMPLATLGQEVPGIDLNAPGEPAPAVEKPPSQVPSTKGEKSASPLETAVGVPGEQDVALGDRVKAVQRKGFLKSGRLQLTAFFAPTVNDAFFQKYGFAARLAYNLREGLAVGVRGSAFTSVDTDYRKQGVRAFESLISTSEIHNELMGEFIWSPVYGKVAFLAHSIVHFDLYLLAGLGAVRSDTSLPPLNEGWHVATDFGGGLRFYPGEWLALELGLLGTFYPDQTERGLPATFQKVIVLNFGVSIFFPTRFEYVYP